MPILLLCLKDDNNYREQSNINKKIMEELTHISKIRELIAILMESPFYLEVPMGERRLLIKKIIEEYHFLAEQIL
jgi:hypothetical protein